MTAAKATPTVIASKETITRDAARALILNRASPPMRTVVLPEGCEIFRGISGPGWVVYWRIISSIMTNEPYIEITASHRTGIDFRVAAPFSTIQSEQGYRSLIKELWQHMCAQEAINGGYV